MSERHNIFGGLINSSVHEFLGELTDIPSGMSFALITCIDSNPGLPALLRVSPELRRVADQGKVVGSGFLMSTRRLLHTDRSHRIFFGFDEMYFFHDRPASSPPAQGLLTGPGIVEDRLILARPVEVDATEWLLLGDR